MAPERSRVGPSGPLALHHSEGKPKVADVPRALLVGVAEALHAGEWDYPRYNWRKGGSYVDLLGSTLRHIFAALEGEDRDPQSDVHHLKHAAADLAFLLDWIARGIIVDDRWQNMLDKIDGGPLA